MNEKTKKEIEEIIRKMQCPKDFQCYQSGLETLCEAKMVGTSDVMVCFEKQPPKCKFVSVKEGCVCNCPLRYYIYVKLNK
ncbi:MAG: hypothetical protein JRF37_05180 [Deltaproteobacteria bacterium]|nr:hypothetical protein [Deltaproteobacteria bacterium]